MKKRSSRSRIAIKDLFRGMARVRVSVLDLKRGYSKQAYDKPQTEEE